MNSYLLYESAFLKYYESVKWGTFMRKRYFMSVGLISLILLSGCGGNSDGRTEITFYGWGNETEVSLTQKFVDDYNNSKLK